MTPIEKRKAELREYIRIQKVDIEFYRSTLSYGAIESTEENARIAEQLLECIERWEKVAD